MPRILVADCYDSFTFNLSHALEAVSGQKVDVHRFDAISLSALVQYSHIVFSPGPGLPGHRPHLLSLVQAALALPIKVLGVCLGHQALAVATGGVLRNLEAVHHGVAHRLTQQSPGGVLFRELPWAFEAGRYHSWVVSEEGLPSCWRVTLRDGQGEIMAMEHLTANVHGIQFHPESIMTPHGRDILSAFVRL